MRRRPTGHGAALAALAGACIAGAGGCGSESLSLRDLRTQAETACATARHRSDAVSAPSVPGGAEAFLRAGVAAYQPEVTTLRRLSADSANASTYRSAVQATDGILGELRASLSSLSAGGDPVVVIRTLQARLAPLEQRANTAWHELGITGCATG